jgi:HK97 family phage major capsid protein
MHHIRLADQKHNLKSICRECPMSAELLETKLGSIENDLKSFIGRNDKGSSEIKARLLCLEQRATAPNGGPSFGGSGESLGDQVVNSDQFRSMKQSNARKSGTITLSNKTAILNAAGQNQPLVAADRTGIIVPPGMRRLTVRDLLPQLNTNSNTVEFAKEDTVTNNAGPQAAEGVAKGESALTFTLSFEPVQTLAHWIPASRQILDDATSLRAYLDMRLVYMLKQVEEDQLLFGTGVAPNLRGLVTSATAYDTSFSTPATDTFIDTIMHGITQVEENSDFPADGVILNSLDWASIQLIKTSGSGADGRYVYSEPHSVTPPSIWGLPVVATKAMPRGQFLTGAFRMACAIYDRSDVTVQISLEHDDFWVRNLAAFLVEERLALVVYRPAALLYSGFPFGS